MIEDFGQKFIGLSGHLSASGGGPRRRGWICLEVLARTRSRSGSVVDGRGGGGLDLKVVLLDFGIDFVLRFGRDAQELVVVVVFPRRRPLSPRHPPHLIVPASAAPPRAPAE